MGGLLLLVFCLRSESGFVGAGFSIIRTGVDG